MTSDLKITETGNMLTLRRYAVTLRHDAGRVTITTTATDWCAAVRAVLNAELAPVSAVVAIEEA